MSLGHADQHDTSGSTHHVSLLPRKLPRPVNAARDGNQVQGLHQLGASLIVVKAALDEPAQLWAHSRLQGVHSRGCEVAGRKVLALQGQEQTGQQPGAGACEAVQTAGLQRGNTSAPRLKECLRGSEDGKPAEGQQAWSAQGPDNQAGSASCPPRALQHICVSKISRGWADELHQAWQWWSPAQEGRHDVH